MSDPLTAAREALAAFDAPRCRRTMGHSAAGRSLCSLPGGHRGPHRAVYYEPSVDHLRAALARVDELEAALALALGAADAGPRR